MSDIAILIPAAGTSSRMRGRDKLLEQVDGQTLLTRQVRMALDTGAPLLVTLPPNRPERQAELDDLGDDRLEVLRVEGAAEGMAASIRAGAKWAGKLGAEGLMVVLADMPELELADLTALQDAFDKSHVIRAVDDSGAPGHPVIFPTRLFEALEQVRGDNGARKVLEAEDVMALALPGGHATTDLDTPEAWADWRVKTGRG